MSANDPEYGLDIPDDTVDAYHDAKDNDRFSTGLTHCPNCGSSDHGMCSKVARPAETEGQRAVRTAKEANLPAGWSEDTRAPFTTFYSADGTVGVTQDEDSGRWFPVVYDEKDEDVKPLGCEDWSTRPAMHDTAAGAAAATPETDAS
jgi:hypothetical protein